MSMLDKIKGLMKGHPDQVRQGVGKGGDFVDKKTGSKYSGQVDSVQQKLNDQLGDRRPPTGEQ
ncbi:antitoxin [Streptomyces sp. NBC_00876]|uniref:antitoxin n=1 Tax=Streptomyces sp. NBC_00876 TaxID=2975853 RepID=UPI00386F7C7F|nr:antitoxin [Streptomyces sp. NBC_00876]